MKYCFGVDIGGTTVKMGLLQTDGRVIEKWEIKTRTEHRGDAILPDVAQSLKEAQKRLALSEKDILAIGVDVPAPVSGEGIVRETANLGWGYKEVKRELEALTGFPVAVGNDANVAALGEMWMGAGKGQKNMLMVTLGTGVGGGVIVDGRPLAGSSGAGGEIGHLCVNESETDVCGCGGRGCLEQYASATGIARLARLRLKKNDDETVLRRVSEEQLDAKAVFDAVKNKDRVAMEIAETFGRYLGHALANVAVVTDPAVIVIGGGVSKAGPVLIDYTEKYFREKAFFANRDTAFYLAKLGNDAGMYGCVRLALDQMEGQERTERTEAAQGSSCIVPSISAK